jgi:hypothetical protein
MQAKTWARASAASTSQMTFPSTHGLQNRELTRCCRKNQDRCHLSSGGSRRTRGSRAAQASLGKRPSTFSYVWADAAFSRSAGVPGLSSVSAALDLQTAQEQGAILKTRDQTHVLNATAPDIFKEYMRKNYRSWVHFGKDNYHSVDYDNLVFVTGVDLTSSCDMLAYQKSSNDMSASFSFDASAFGSASLSA